MATTYSGMINLDRLGLYDSLIKQDVQTALAGKSDVGHTHNIASIVRFDTVAGWAANLSYVPARGEIIVVTDYAQDANGDNVAALKVGDGLAYAADLPIVMQSLEETVRAHVDNSGIHVTAAEKASWNAKWRGYMSSVSGEELVFTTN